MTSIFRNDTYQLSMLYAHWKNGRQKLHASAEAFFRKRPHDLNHLQMDVVMAAAYRVNALLNSDVMTSPFTYDDMPFVQNDLLHLGDEEFEPFQKYLLEEFPSELQSLEVMYARDGEVLAPNFPVVQVTGPIGAIHMLETPFLNYLNTSVRAASIARCIRKAAGHSISLMDFSTRRQDDAAAVHVGVAATIGGFDATSNMESGRMYHVPAKGTMAHAYVLSYGMRGELQAFKDFMRAYPATHVLLVDTFDIMTGVANAIRAAYETGIPLNAIRLDSGEWTETLPAVRKMLDMMGCTRTKIVVSGDFSESLINHLIRRDVFKFIDGIGIGSRLGSPEFSMGFVYKLVEIENQPVMKFSAGGKASLPCRKIWFKAVNEKDERGNVLLPFTPNLLGSQCEVVLREDPGPVPVGEEYIREARALTAKRLAANETFWDTSEIDRVADTLR
jgi:nicotinate phosphoribosyltransferase